MVSRRGREPRIRGIPPIPFVLVDPARAQALEHHFVCRCVESVASGALPPVAPAQNHERAMEQRQQRASGRATMQPKVRHARNSCRVRGASGHSPRRDERSLDDLNISKQGRRRRVLARRHRRSATACECEPSLLLRVLLPTYMHTISYHHQTEIARRRPSTLTMERPCYR